MPDLPLLAISGRMDGLCRIHTDFPLLTSGGATLPVCGKRVIQLPEPRVAQRHRQVCQRRGFHYDVGLMLLCYREDVFLAPKSTTTPTNHLSLLLAMSGVYINYRQIGVLACLSVRYHYGEFDLKVYTMIHTQSHLSQQNIGV